MKHSVILVLCLVLSLVGVACTSAVEGHVVEPVIVTEETAGNTTLNNVPDNASDCDATSKHAARLADLDYLCSHLAMSHPDMFRNTTRDAVERKRQEIITKMDDLDDFSFAIELQTLVAMLGDSHTTINVNNLVDEDFRMLPVRLKSFDGRWILSTVPAELEQYLGYELLSLNGHPMREVYTALAPFISHDNDVKLERQFLSTFYVVPILRHFGIVADESVIPLVLGFPKGESVVVTIPVIAAKDAQSYSFSMLSRQRASMPATEWDRSRNYKAFELDDDTLYVQYNVCQEDKDLPMEVFVGRLDRMMADGNYGRIILDMCNNGGGSDGGPLISWLGKCLEAGQKVYTLIGETTFSAAVNNGVLLQMAGSVLVGTPSSGNVNHFGSTDAFVLPNLPLQVRYSTKYMNLAEHFGVADRYGDSPLAPDVTVGQSLSDYLAGIDTTVEYVLAMDE